MDTMESTRGVVLITRRGHANDCPDRQHDHPVVATMIGGGLEGCGPSQPLPTVN
jgi:hypothetical protein